MPDVASWFVLQGEKKVGPFVSSKLKDMVQTGRLKPQDLVWKEGFADWVQADRVKGLFDKANSVGGVGGGGGVATNSSGKVRSTPPSQGSRQASGRASVQASIQAPARPAVDAWYVYTADGETFGPIPIAEMDMWVQQRRVGCGAQVLREGEEEWSPVESLYPQLVPQHEAQARQASGRPSGHPARRRGQGSQRLLNLPFALKFSGYALMITHVGMGIVNLIMFMIGMGVFLKLTGAGKLEPKLLSLFISSGAMAAALQVVLFRLGYGLTRGQKQAIYGSAVMFVISMAVAVIWMTSWDSLGVRSASFLFISPLITLVPEVILLSMLGAYAFFVCLPPVLAAKGTWNNLR